MRVVVAAVEEDCPAHLALAMEGVPHELVQCQGENGYGELLAQLWREGQGFVLVEHDVVPWPTAVTGLISCPFHWCCFQYPMNTGTPYGEPDCLGKSLGLVKFGPHLLLRFPDLWKAWEGVPWWVVDGHLEPALRNAHMVTVHQHLPPVAHVKQQVG